MFSTDPSRVYYPPEAETEKYWKNIQEKEASLVDLRADQSNLPEQEPVNVTKPSNHKNELDQDLT